MESIREGASGAAVEDIQERLGSLGYAIASDETSAGVFGKSTGTAVARFRIDHDLPLGDVLDALDARRPGLHVVVTGRNAKPELIEAADLVTEMKLVKHPFRAGVKGQLGIEF